MNVNNAAMNLIPGLGQHIENLPAIKATTSGPEYFQKSTADMIQNFSDAYGKAPIVGPLNKALIETTAPVLSAVTSLPYDFYEATQRMKPGSGIKGLYDAWQAEKPWTAAKNRFIGAAQPLANRITNVGTSIGEGIHGLFNPKETSIDPTGKNLFSQYGYDEDEFSGIEGQTAFLDPASIYALLKAGTSKKKIGQYLLKNQILKQTGKKIGPDLKRRIRQTQGEKFGGSGIFKNIATGSKDYGPYAKPTTKPYVAPLGPRGEASEQITTPPKRYVSPARPHSADPPSGGGGGGGGGGPPGGQASWKGNSGGLVNFYRYGGFI